MRGVAARHFLDASTSTGHAKKSLRELLASVPQETLSPRKSSTADAGGDAGSPNRRRRKSEKEEDAELIQIGASDDTVFQFQSTPKCTSPRLSAERSRAAGRLTWRRGAARAGCPL